MAKTDRFIALDISSECIRLAVVSCEPSGDIHIVQSGSVSLAADSSSGMSQDAMIAMALKRLLDETRPGVRKTVIAVDGQSVFSRLVKLPPVAADRVQQTIRHEAVQNIPFPLDEVVWDAHIFNPDATEPEVLLVAVKADYVSGVVHAATANGLLVERVIPAPVALADAVRSESRGSDDPVLLADITDGAVNLVFVDGCRTFFRTIPRVGEDVARFAQEIERSISFYSGQQGGRSPVKLLLSGGGGIYVEEIAGQLNIPVEVFSATCVGTEDAGPLVVGVAVHSGLKDRVDLNVLPQSLKDERAMQGRKSLWAVSALLTLLLAGLWGWFLNGQADLLQKRELAVSRSVAALSEVERELLPVEEETALLKRDFDVFAESVEKRMFWLDTFNDIDRLIPDGMFLLSSTPLRADGELQGLQVLVVSYLDKEPDGQDAVKLLRDSFRQSERFSARSSISSRPSKQLFARSFVLDLFFEEVP